MALNNFNPNAGDTDDIDTTPPNVPLPPPFDPDDDYSPEEFLINYNEKYKNEAPIMFRDEVVQQTLSCLIGKFKPNALLVGAAGVGKTRIVEDIARRIATNDPLIPEQLKDHTIWELPLSNIISGSSLVGQVEKKAKAVIKFASDPDNKAIIFIDEIHMLIERDSSYDKVAQMLKPAMSRGNIKMIGATTLQESQNLINDPAFNRRFTRLIVDELSQEQTMSILDSMKPMMFNHYNNKIVINDKIIKEIVSVADEYKTMGSHRPDNAITLLDRAMADAYIQRKKLEEAAKDDPAMMKMLQSTPSIALSKSQMKKTAMKLMTGNNEKTEIQIDDLKNSLSVIKGQDNIIEYLLDALERDNLNLYPRTKPLTLLFAGNSGVGKSEIAKIIAQEITNTKPIILNMTEYYDSASINRIIGSPIGYVGSDTKREFPFDILESNPYQIILLDEFEKSNKAVQRLFMSAFDEGYIKMAKGTIIDFSKAIIIATTNAGHTTKSESIGFTQTGKNANAATISDLSEFFDIEMLNRFTRVLNFNPITESLFKDILIDTYERQIKQIKNAHSAYSFMPDTLPDDDVTTLIKDNFAKEFGARPVKKAIQKYIEDKIIQDKRNKMLNAATNTDTD